MRTRLAYYEWEAYKDNIGSFRAALMRAPNVIHTFTLINGETVALKHGTVSENGIDQPYVEIGVPGSDSKEIIPLSNKQLLQNINSNILEYPDEYDFSLVTACRCKQIVAESVAILSDSRPTIVKFERYSLLEENTPEALQNSDAEPTVTSSDDFFDVNL